VPVRAKKSFSSRFTSANAMSASAAFALSTYWGKRMAAAAARSETIATATMTSVSVKACCWLWRTILGTLPVGQESDQKIRLTPRFLVTFFTIQCFPEMLPTPLLSRHPWPVGHWGLMPDMLSMAASQVGHPVALFVLVESNNRLIHVRTVSSLGRWKRPFRPYLGRKKFPATGGIGIKRAEIDETGLHRSEFHELDPAALWIKAPHIELSDDVKAIRRSLIDIPAADAACIGKQIARGQASAGRSDRESEIEPGQKGMGGDPRHRHVCPGTG